MNNLHPASEPQSPSNPTSMVGLKIIEPQPPLEDFSLDKFSPRMQEVIRANNWADLMPVQKKAIPYLLAAQDIIVQSKTGSGKTGAFILPILEVIEVEHRRPQALILVPTRELAVQVYEEAVRFGKPLGIEAVALYGGVAYGPQLEALKKGVHLVVGTPGRVLDQILNGPFRLNSIRDWVMDEADEMLSMGFYPDMKRIHGLLPKERCTFLFSATIPANVKRLSQEFLRQPKFMSLSPEEVSVTNMDHLYFVVEPTEKDVALLKLIEQENPESAIIFCNTRRDVSYVYEFLLARGLKVGIISGDVQQKARQQVMRDLKAGKIGLLVATDVAARGIDIQGLSHVFLYDHPDDSEVYIHRAGRTARAGNFGRAISLVSLLEEIPLKATAAQFGINFIKQSLPSDQELEKLIRERTNVFLDQDFRQTKQWDKKGAARMLPLLDELLQLPEEREALGLMLHRYYWERFTGLPFVETAATETEAEAEVAAAEEEVVSESN